MNAPALEIRGATLDGHPVDIATAEGRITAVTPAASHDRPNRDGAGRVIDARGLHVFPSFRNAHTHVAMTLFRGYGDDMPLMEWLQTRIWPAEARLTEDDVFDGARLGMLENARRAASQ